MRSAAYPVVVAKKHNPNPLPPKDTDNKPRRITSNVRQNLRFIKLREQRNSQIYQPKVVNSFRRKKGLKELEEDEVIDSDNTTQESLTGDLVVLVDAYNLCGQWEELKPDFMSGRLSTARDKLIESLIIYSEVQELKVVAVFDAAKSGKRANKETVAGVDIVYAGGLEADEWIVREVETLMEAGSPALVVTSDIYVKNELLELVLSVFLNMCIIMSIKNPVKLLGTSVWSCETFISGIKDAEEEYCETIERERIGQKRLANMPVEYPLPLDVPALKILKKKLLDEDMSNARDDEASVTQLSTPDPATTDLNTSNQSNGSLRKEKVQIVKLQKRGYGSYFRTLDDLRRRIS